MQGQGYGEVDGVLNALRRFPGVADHEEPQDLHPATAGHFNGLAYLIQCRISMEGVEDLLVAGFYPEMNADAAGIGH